MFKPGDEVKCVDAENQEDHLLVGSVYTVAKNNAHGIKLEELPNLNFYRDRFVLADQASSYEEIAARIGRLVQEKQRAYGDSFGKSGEVLKILYPDGISTEQLKDALTITRILDKLFRIATDKDALGEDPWQDIAGYAILATERSSK